MAASLDYSAATTIDVVVVCALAIPELERLKKTNNGKWQAVPASPDDPTAYYFTTYTTASGRPVRILARAPNPMGPTATAARTTQMIWRFRPKLVARVGIA